MILGIDVGTSKVAAVIIEQNGKVAATQSSPYKKGAGVKGRYAEQDTAELLELTRQTVGRLPDGLKETVGAVGVTGQMHGVVILDDNNEPLTPLVTWQDKRCEDDFLEELNKRTGYKLRKGYGCSTLAWYCHYSNLPRQAASAATIQDLLVADLCGLNRAVTDSTDAASWGLFSLRRMGWDGRAVKRAGIPKRLLPEVRPCGSQAGRVSERAAKKFGIRAGIPVATAIGDNQASLVGTLTDFRHQVGLSIGTGAQVSVVEDRSKVIRKLSADSKCEVRPFPGKRVAIVAASLSGGEAWGWLADAVEGFCRDAGVECPDREELYRKFNEHGLSARSAPVVKPLFFGERYDEQLAGAIEGISRDNFTLGHLAQGLAEGIVRNLRQMVPQSVLLQRKEIVGSGGALRRNRLLGVMVEKVFDLPLVMSEDREEAAVGAAMQTRELL